MGNPGDGRGWRWKGRLAEEGEKLSIYEKLVGSFSCRGLDGDIVLTICGCVEYEGAFIRVLSAPARPRVPSLGAFLKLKK